MIKQCVPVVAISVIVSACAAMDVPPAQTVAVAGTVSPTTLQTSDTGNPGAPQATVTRVMWFFGDR
jgi:hypothetical protein